MITKCAFCEKEMLWTDAGAVTVAAHAIYEDAQGEKTHGRVALMFCSDECVNKFAETMSGKNLDFQKTIVEMEKEIEYLKEENKNLALVSKELEDELRDKDDW